MFMTKTIVSNLLKKYATRLHPFEQRVLPEGFRGRFKFVIDKCIMCRQCAIKCPTAVIHIDPEVGLWEREVMGCLYCGVCADVCPTGCITMTNVYRPPITEPAFLRFNVKPRPSRKAAQAATRVANPVEEGIQEKIAEKAAEGTNVSKKTAVEEAAVEARPATAGDRGNDAAKGKKDAPVKSGKAQKK